MVFALTAVLALLAAELTRLLSVAVASGRSASIDFGLKRPG